MAKLVCDVWADVGPSVAGGCATSSAQGFFLRIYIKKEIQDQVLESITV